MLNPCCDGESDEVNTPAERHHGMADSYFPAPELLNVRETKMGGGLPEALPDR
jgi:hypothetical protein